MPTKGELYTITIAIIQPTRLVHSFLFLFFQCQSPQQLASDVKVSNLAAVWPAKHTPLEILFNAHSFYALIASSTVFTYSSFFPCEGHPFPQTLLFPHAHAVMRERACACAEGSGLPRPSCHYIAYSLISVLYITNTYSIEPIQLGL